VVHHHDRVLPAGPGPNARNLRWLVFLVLGMSVLVLVLAMGTALAHMLRDDARAARTTDQHRTGHSGRRSVSWSPQEQAWSGPDPEAAEGRMACGPPAAGAGLRFGITWPPPAPRGRIPGLSHRLPGRHGSWPVK
jgi:hypothetical protein